MRRLFAVLTAGAIAVIVVLWGGSVPAFAHAHPSATYPADGAELDESPTEIRITFTEPIEAEASRLIIQDANGQPIHGAHQSSPDASTLVVTVPPLTDGVYTAVWEVLSTDTHTTSGQFTFSVATPLPQTVPVQPSAPGGGSAPPAPGGSSTPPAGSTENPADRGGASAERDFPWLWVVVGTGVLILFGVGMRRR